ncbi:MAG: beta-N-acetylhexosaminidase [Rhodospirillaceae bacterium]|nr:beta-N-acetylhexosaminidase [Rhodospirillaceae bacterium]
MTVCAAIFGLAGPTLGDGERRFFRSAAPAGFVLFARNCRTPDQVRALTAELREAVGRSELPILIDQEGGRVARLKPPHWRSGPPAAAFGALADRDPAAAVEAVRLNARLIGLELAGLGITVDCLPVLDLRRPETHTAIGDRAFHADPRIVTALGRAACEGLLASGVLPVIKHMPGHGRATVDSHHELPRISAPLETLRAADFVPFRALRAMPLGMTGHLLFEAIDGNRPASQSALVIGDIIRRDIGFDGLLISDDLGMRALAGSAGERAAACLAAGCDVALHCSGVLSEMEEVAAAAGPLRPESQARLERAMALLRATPATGEAPAVLAGRLDRLMQHARA